MKSVKKVVLVMLIGVIWFSTFGMVLAEENSDSLEMDLVEEQMSSIEATQVAIERIELKEPIKKKAETYIVTFVANDKVFRTENVEEGQCVLQPPDPKPKSKDALFVAWETSGGKEYDFATPITNDLTLYAAFVYRDDPIPAAPLKITFDSNGGSKVDSQEIKRGHLVKKPENPVKPGYYFMGWYTKSGAKWDFSEPPVGSMTLYAHWTKNDPSPSTSDTGQPWSLMLLLCGAAIIGTLCYKNQKQ